MIASTTATTGSFAFPKTERRANLEQIQAAAQAPPKKLGEIQRLSSLARAKLVSFLSSIPLRRKVIDEQTPFR